MKVIDKYNLYKNKYSKYIVLIKVGIFYEAYGEDVYILNNLFSYKIKEINGVKRVGFPISSYDKVISKFRCFKINYVIVEDDDVTRKKFNFNNYDKYVPNDLSLEDRINKVYDRLRVLKDNSNIIDVLDRLEEILW